MNKSRFHITEAVLVIALCALDQFTKLQAVRYLKGQPDRILIEGVLQLSYVENTGAAFGVFQNARMFFIIVTLIVIAILIHVLRRMPADKRYHLLGILLSLILAGAAGNLIDRIRTVYVVDFIYFSLIDFPVFNVADICVTVGVILLLLVLLFYYQDEELSFLRMKSEKTEEKTAEEEFVPEETSSDD